MASRAQSNVNESSEKAEGRTGGQFLRAVNSASVYAFQDNDLFIDLGLDSGTIPFPAD
ncbi:MAG: hypothetical protein WBA99_07345 [Nodosilinea sp.]